MHNFNNNKKITKKIYENYLKDILKSQRKNDCKLKIYYLLSTK